MTTLLKRMEEVLRLRGWSGREWARIARLSEETHVNTIMRRLAKDPSNQWNGDAAIFAKLADAARVSLDWLVLGRGGPYGVSIYVQADAAYPSRAPVLAIAAWLGFSQDVIHAVAAQAPASDPGTQHWLTRLEVEQMRLHAAPVGQPPLVEQAAKGAPNVLPSNKPKPQPPSRRKPNKRPRK